MGSPCPLKSGAFHPDAVIASQAAVLVGEKRQVVWPDYHDPKIRSSMFRPPVPMSAETKEKLRAITPQRDVGDEVAKMLREAASLDDTYAIGAKYLHEKEPALRAKYEHLNPGQQRMVIGNRMRAKWKKENLK